MDALTRRLLLRRGLLLWFVLRLVLTAFTIPLDGSFELQPVTALLFSGVVGCVAVIDVRATREQIFLANIGVGTRHTFAITAGVAVAIELTFLVIARAVS